MNGILLEHQEIYQGYHLVVMFILGHRHGYVGLPNGHKFVGMNPNEYKVIGMDYNNELDNLSVHGGITYGGIPYGDVASFKSNDYEWYLGFHCSHFGDADDIESMEKYGADKEAIELSKRFFNHGEVRTKEYVLNELYNLVEQLKGE